MDLGMIMKVAPLVTKAVSDPNAKDKLCNVLDQWGLSLDDFMDLVRDIGNAFGVDIGDLLNAKG